MQEPENFLLSIAEKYVRCMLVGEKTVEFRRRAIPIFPDSNIWIYTKLPKGCIETYAIVDCVFDGAISTIWQRFAKHGGVSKSEFQKYFSGCTLGSAILFKEIQKLVTPVTLQDIRKRCNSFHPPQFYKRLPADGPELKLLARVRRTPVQLGASV